MRVRALTRARVRVRAGVARSAFQTGNFCQFPNPELPGRRDVSS